MKRTPISLIIPIFVGLLASLLMLPACNLLSSDNTESDIIAVVGERKLHRSDVDGIVPDGVYPEDSVRIIRDYINSWVRKQLVVQKAEKNLPEQMKNFEFQIEDYRNSLLTYQYEKEIVSQKLDTLVSDEEILGYYEQNQENFLLKDNIIKGIYVKVPSNAPDMGKLKVWMKSEKEEDREKLKDYCINYATNFFLEEETWLLFNDILKEIPIRTYDQESYLKYNRFVETWDSSSVYLLNIKGFRIKETISPLNFEVDKIRSIILNKRKLEIIRQLEEDIYQEGVRKKNFVTFI
ncbi:MAG: peptidyl-prolyl cis-trans isomerase [Bacteroidetes bacterium]|nr:peptidyl-prolyl cis-trans isomerase [Bacteroidota bacterium]MBU1718313.1 peptidyl-prolyl cis-trans isomerase [Bacteroidota bacterium]